MAGPPPKEGHPRCLTLQLLPPPPSSLALPQRAVPLGGWVALPSHIGSVWEAASISRNSHESCFSERLHAPTGGGGAGGSVWHCCPLQPSAWCIGIPCPLLRSTTAKPNKVAEHTQFPLVSCTKNIQSAFIVSGLLQLIWNL